MWEHDIACLPIVGTFVRWTLEHSEHWLIAGYFDFKWAWDDEFTRRI